MSAIGAEHPSFWAGLEKHDLSLEHICRAICRTAQHGRHSDVVGGLRLARTVRGVRCSFQESFDKTPSDITGHIRGVPAVF
jgi:hypothetical protein